MISALIVDDSRFFRRRIKEIVEADGRIQVLGMAENGEQAIELACQLRPDVIVMDIEMPVLDGISAVKAIMARCPTRILMFSSLTRDGAKPTLDALEAGAVDYLPKKVDEISRDMETARQVLCDRLVSIAAGAAASGGAAPRPAGHVPQAGRQQSGNELQVSLVVIGTSTGGPVALQNLLMQLPESFPVPVVLVQHMPAAFTSAFAERLNKSCAIRVVHAEDYQLLQPGTAYLAPGGRQFRVVRRGSSIAGLVEDSDEDMTYKPSVDFTFASVSEAVPGKSLGVVLTGMGADGRVGAGLMKKSGSIIWAQDKASSVVYGMPGAVSDAGLVSESYDPAELGRQLARRIG